MARDTSLAWNSSPPCRPDGRWRERDRPGRRCRSRRTSVPTRSRAASSARRRSTSTISGRPLRAAARATTWPGAVSGRRSAASSGSGSRSVARRWGGPLGRRDSPPRSCFRRASSTAGAATTSLSGWSSRSPTPAAASSASRRGSSGRMTRCGPSTSTRRKASSSERATCSTGFTRPGRRSPRPTVPTSSRATPTCSRCAKQDSSRWSPRWAPL